MQILLLLSITWLIGLTTPVLTIANFKLSWRDIILATGGIFLLINSILEIHHKIEGDEHDQIAKNLRSYGNAIVQIVLLDIIISIDSILFAIGLTEELMLMIIAAIVSIIVTMILARTVGYIPTVPILP